MSKSRFEYVKQFETQDNLLPNTWIVIRIDGTSFGNFVNVHKYIKPVDSRGNNLMDRCAQETMKRYGDLVLAYGHSDEYSFVLRRDSVLYSRRASKLSTSISSSFSSFFVFYWREYFPDTPLQYPPSFDGRCVCYSTDTNLKDYISWRQVYCHINNLYNTAFWNLVKLGNLPPKQARLQLNHASTAQINEILFSQFDINYNTLPAMFRRGSLIIWQDFISSSSPAKKHNENNENKNKSSLQNQTETQASSTKLATSTLTPAPPQSTPTATANTITKTDPNDPKSKPILPAKTETVQVKETPIPSPASEKEGGRKENNVTHVKSQWSWTEHDQLRYQSLFPGVNISNTGE